MHLCSFWCLRCRHPDLYSQWPSSCSRQRNTHNPFHRAHIHLLYLRNVWSHTHTAHLYLFTDVMRGSVSAGKTWCTRKWAVCVWTEADDWLIWNRFKTHKQRWVGSAAMGQRYRGILRGGWVIQPYAGGLDTQMSWHLNPAIRYWLFHMCLTLPQELGQSNEPFLWGWGQREQVQQIHSEPDQVCFSVTTSDHMPAEFINTWSPAVMQPGKHSMIRWYDASAKPRQIPTVKTWKTKKLKTNIVKLLVSNGCNKNIKTAKRIIKIYIKLQIIKHVKQIKGMLLFVKKHNYGHK